MNGYRLTSEAQRDLESIAEYIAQEQSADRALKVLDEIVVGFRKLASMPGIGHHREALLDRRYRFWSVYSYVIVYRGDVSPIQVIAVIHGARDLDALLWQRELDE